MIVPRLFRYMTHVASYDCPFPEIWEFLWIDEILCKWRKYVVKFLLSIILWLLIAGCTKQTRVFNIRSKMEKCKFKDLFSIHVLSNHQPHMYFPIFRHFRPVLKISKIKLLWYKELVIHIKSWYLCILCRNNKWHRNYLTQTRFKLSLYFYVPLLRTQIYYLITGE